MLPVFIKVMHRGEIKKVHPKQSESKESEGEIVSMVYMRIIAINSMVMALSAIMVMVTKRELMFP